MLLNWNPFSQLRKTKHYPFSYLITSTLSERFTRTFLVFFAKDPIINKDGPDQIGVIDYLVPVFLLIYPLLEIFREAFAELLVSHRFREWNLLTKIAYSLIVDTLLLAISIVTFIPSVVLLLTKSLLAGVLTVAATPLILLVHLSAFLYKLYLTQDIEKLSVTERQFGEGYSRTVAMTMGQFLEGKSSEQTTRLYARRLIEESKEIKKIPLAYERDKSDEIVTIVIDTSSAKTASAAVTALLRMNKFAITDLADSEPRFYEALQKIQRAHR